MKKKNFNLKGFLVENKLTEASRGNSKRIHYGEVELSDKVRLLGESKELSELTWQFKDRAANAATKAFLNSENDPAYQYLKCRQAAKFRPGITGILRDYGLEHLADSVDKTALWDFLQGKKDKHFSFLFDLSDQELRKLSRAAKDYQAYVASNSSVDEIRKPLNEAGYVDDSDFDDDDLELGTARGTDDIEYDPRAARAAGQDIASNSFDDDEEESFDDPDDLDDDEDVPAPAEEPTGEVSLSDLNYNPSTVEWDPNFDIQEYVSQWPENKWPVIIRVLQQGLNQAQKEANENGGVWRRGLYMYRCSRTDSNKQLGYNTRDYKTSVTNPTGKGDFIQMIAKIKPDPQAMKDLGWD